MKTVLLLIALIGLVCAGDGCGSPPAGTGTSQPALTLGQAVERARTELRRLGRDTPDRPLVSQADDANSAWTQRTRRIPSLLQSPQVQSMKLAERSYWAIYFAPQPTAGSTIKGGDAYVFIDRVTGEVMGTLFGK